MLLLLLVPFGVLLFAGMPVAFGMMLATAVYLVGSSESLTVLAQKMGNAPDSFTLLGLPLFLLAGSLMNQGGMKIAEQAPKRGVRVLGYWIGGVRDAYGNRAVRNPDDFKGMKLRTMQTPLYVALFRAYGAIPTPIAWPETYLALAQGTVDGPETALVAMHDNKQYEVVKYATRTKHAISAAPFVVSERWWQGLAPDLQQAVLTAEQETRKLARENFFEYDRTVVDDLKKKGMTVVEPDLAPLREVALKIYPQFEKDIGRETIQAVLDTK